MAERVSASGAVGAAAGVAAANAPVQDEAEPGAEAGGVRRPQKPVGVRAFIETVGTGGFIKVCGLVQGVVLARLLGPLGRGCLELVTFWPTLIAALGMFGVDMAIRRRAARERDIGVLTRTTFPLSLMLSLVAVGAGYLLLPYLIPDRQAWLLPYAVLFLAFIPANHLTLNLRAIDQGTGHFRRYNLARAVLNPVYLAGIAFIWLMGMRGIHCFVIALLAANLVVLVVRVTMAVRSSGLTGPIHPPLRILREGLPYWFAHISELVHASADKILLIWLLGPRALGLYVVSLAAGSMLSAVGFSANTVVFTAAAQSPRWIGYCRSAKAFRMMAWMWLLVGGGLALLVPWLLPVVYGEGFAAAVVPAIVLIAASALVMQARLLDDCQRGQGRPFAGVAARGAATVIFAALGIAARGRWELLGVTCILAAGQAAYLGCLVVSIARRDGAGAPLLLVPRLSDMREVMERVKALPQWWKGSRRRGGLSQ